MQKETNKNLVNYNTFGLNVFAKEFFSIENKDELCEIDFSEKFLILGGGSNMLIVSDLGRVIQLKTNDIKLTEETNEIVKLKVEAGVVWDEFVDFCVKNNYYGAENLSLIPGTVGAAPIQNIGAYGAEVKNIIESVEYFDIKTKEIKTINRTDCQFGYRSSIFKKNLKNKIVVTAVNFLLQKKSKLNISYGGLKKYFSDCEPTLSSVRQTVIKVRNEKLPMPEKLGNSGSFFKNAIVDATKLNELQQLYPDMLFFEVDNGYKIPTAWLIETAGLKGFRHRNAGVFENHALILVNLGGATAKDILELSEIIENRIFDKFGIKIYKEVNVIS